LLSIFTENINKGINTLSSNTFKTEDLTEWELILDANIVFIDEHKGVYPELELIANEIAQTCFQEYKQEFLMRDILNSYTLSEEEKEVEEEEKEIEKIVTENLIPEKLQEQEDIVVDKVEQPESPYKGLKQLEERILATLEELKQAINNVTKENNIEEVIIETSNNEEPEPATTEVSLEATIDTQSNPITVEDPTLIKEENQEGEEAKVVEDDSKVLDENLNKIS
jgi:hypothetical protein